MIPPMKSPEEQERAATEAPRTSFRRAQMGFNNNLRYQGAAYHLQTEDSGLDRAHVISHLFADGGRILKSTKRSYAAEVAREDIAEYVRALMKAQHLELALALRDGQLDEVIAGRARGGLDVREDLPASFQVGAPSTAASTSSEAVSPSADPGGGGSTQATRTPDPSSEVPSAAVGEGLGLLTAPGAPPPPVEPPPLAPAPAHDAAHDAGERSEAATPRPSRLSLELLRSFSQEQDSLESDASVCTLGRTGDLRLEDPFCRGLEATLSWREEDLRLTPSPSGSGVFRRIVLPCPLFPGDEFLLGDQLLRVEEQTPPPPSLGAASTYRYPSPRPVSSFRIVQVLEGGAEGAAVVARGTALTLGSGRVDFAFPDDRLVSEKHCLLSERDGDLFLQDLDSRTGVFLRLRGTVVLRDDDELILGRTRLRVRFGA